MGGTQSRGRSIIHGINDSDTIAYNNRYKSRQCFSDLDKEYHLYCIKYLGAQHKEYYKYIESLKDHEDDLFNSTLYNFIADLRYFQLVEWPNTTEYHKQEFQARITNVFVDFLDKWSYYLTKSEINMINKKIIINICKDIKNERPGIWTKKINYKFTTPYDRMMAVDKYNTISKLFGGVLKKISSMKTLALTQPPEFFERLLRKHKREERERKIKKRKSDIKAKTWDDFDLNYGHPRLEPIFTPLSSDGLARLYEFKREGEYKIK